MQTVRFHHAGQTRETTQEAYEAVLGEMVQTLGPWAPGNGSRIERIEPAKALSTWGEGKQVLVPTAAARIASVKAAASAAGFTDVTGRQLYQDTTRMAQSGYDNETGRDQAHAAKRPARDVLREFAETIENEKRRDRVMTAGEMARKLAINGKLNMDGWILRPHAVKGTLARLESKAGGYIQALRDRIAETQKGDPQRAADKAQMLATLVRELESKADLPLNLRMRAGVGDVFAVTSPSYGAADFNMIAGDILDALPTDAKASVSYDPTNTAWQIIASVRTNVAALDRVVGELTQVDLSLRGADAGNSGIHGGTLAMIIACLNAMILEARGETVSRTHRTHVLKGIRDLVKAAMTGMDAITAAWQAATVETIDATVTTDAGILIPLETVIPGFFRNMLSRPRGELVGVLAGRKEEHVAALATAYGDQRRNTQDVTRADLAQAYTRYVRDLPDLAARTEAQAAIGSWMARREPVIYQAR